VSDEALQRTVRRTGAVVVFAIGTLTMSFRDYATYEGVPVDVPPFVVFLLLGGPLAYLAGSFLLGVVATVVGGDHEAPEDGERTANSPE
jgi:hypothetical protein